jgi:hypothetical protein
MRDIHETPLRWYPLLDLWRQELEVRSSSMFHLIENPACSKAGLRLATAEVPGCRQAGDVGGSAVVSICRYNVLRSRFWCSRSCEVGFGLECAVLLTCCFFCFRHSSTVCWYDHASRYNGLSC